MMMMSQVHEAVRAGLRLIQNTALPLQVHNECVFVLAHAHACNCLRSAHTTDAHKAFQLALRHATPANLQVTTHHTHTARKKHQIKNQKSKNLMTTRNSLKFQCSFKLMQCMQLFCLLCLFCLFVLFALFVCSVCLLKGEFKESKAQNSKSH
eukprot:c5707_g1_i1.p1 GENE.c5707_g1_i1~~c5707_g1_i1.p1  ORF type:complete len:152 (+),score=40.43 c5707_g1_i1:725-1180(+)